MQQYFPTIPLHLGETVELDEEISRHQITVLRQIDGDRFRLVDPDKRVFLVELRTQNDHAFAHILQELDEDNEMPVKVTIIQALIKGDKWDYFLQKSTECGVARIVPFISERNVVKWDPKTDQKKLERWRKIVREAAEQSKRNLIPEVTFPIRLDELPNHQSEMNFVAYENASHTDRQLKDIRFDASSVTLLIGSEGGFTPREIESCIAFGYEPIGLGRRILRAETAAIVALTLIESGTLNKP
jgi:16S rRNA (uracil1498-N3)-methyltransferase